MARGLGGLTALRAALGGVAGGLQGLGEMREARRLQEQQALAAERQRAMDELAMLNQGFMRVEDMAGERQQTGQALSRALSSAAAMMRPGGMAGGAAPPLQQGDLRRMAEAPGMESPQQRVTLGGATYQRESPTAAALRRAELETARERMAAEQKTAQEAAAREQNVTAAMNAYKLTRPQAEEFVRTGKSPFVEAQTPMTEFQRADLAERRAARADARAAREAGAAGGGRRAAGGQQMSKTSLGTTLPSVQDAADRLNKMNVSEITALRPNVMDMASGAGKSSGTFLGIPTGPVVRYGVAKFMEPTSSELQYVQEANAIADAIARATDVGVLSNFDIDRFRMQVVPTALDDSKVQAFKFNTLKGWANWLANNRNALEAADAAYESGKPLPDEALRWKGELPANSGVRIAAGAPERRGQGAPAAGSGKPSGAPAEDDVYRQAKARIEAGGDRQAVIQRYESITGRKWPGG